MSDKRIKLPSDGLIILPSAVLPLLPEATEGELKTLIYYFSSPDADLRDASNATGLSREKLESACDYWRRNGIFEDSDEAQRKKPLPDSSPYRNYDSETLSKAIDGKSEFALLCSLAQDKLEKQLTKNDYSTLFYLYDFVRIPAPVICGVIEYCCGRDKKSLQYIYKKSIALFEDGIDSYDRFEQYLAERELVGTSIGSLRKLCGMGERMLTAKEERLFECWFSEWKLPFELVKLAYEKTVDGKGMLSFTYMNGILRRWHESGFTSLEDVAKNESGRPKQGESSFSGDDFVEAALSRGFES